MDFEKDMQRLEEIVSALETGSMKLDDSMEMYKEGVELAAKLSGALTSAEEKFNALKEPVEL